MLQDMAAHRNAFLWQSQTLSEAVQHTAPAGMEEKMGEVTEPEVLAS